MARCSTRLLLTIGALVLGALTVYYLMDANILLPHHTEAGSKRRAVERARQIDAGEVEQFVIYVSKYHGTIHLKRPEDGPDIDRLWRSVQQIRVVDHEAWFLGQETCALLALIKGKRQWTTFGHFDPRYAPVISACQRSDDLAAIVQDIIKRKARPNKD